MSQDELSLLIARPPTRRSRRRRLSAISDTRRSTSNVAHQSEARPGTLTGSPRSVETHCLASVRHATTTQEPKAAGPDRPLMGRSESSEKFPAATRSRDAEQPRWTLQRLGITVTARQLMCRRSRHNIGRELGACSSDSRQPSGPCSALDRTRVRSKTRLPGCARNARGP